MMRPVVQFLALFAGIAASFYALALWQPFERAFYGYLAANARMTGALLRMIGVHAQVHGLSVTTPAYSITIMRGCDGIEPAWIFSAAVIAFPSSLRRKLAVLPVGVALILGANIVRILSLFFIGWRLPAFLPVAHLELWPAAFMGFVIALWLRWARRPGEARPGRYAQG
jgi:exosortase H (IPTLxxWG-CTERM-specific)